MKRIVLRIGGYKIEETGSPVANMILEAIAESIKMGEPIQPMIDRIVAQERASAAAEERRRCAKIATNLATGYHKIAHDRRVAGKSPKVDGARGKACGEVHDAIIGATENGKAKP